MHLEGDERRLAMRRFDPARLLVALTAGAAISACATPHADFRPTERVRGYTMEGFEEAFYDLPTAGVSNSEVKVWSDGAEPTRTAEGVRTGIRVGFTIDNGGREPIEVASEALRLESLQAAAALPRDLPAESVTGDTTVQPGTSGTAEALFLLPRGVAPRDVQAFRVKWSVRSEGQEFTEFTPFVQDRPEYAYVPVYGYYYPYWPWSYPFYDPFFVGRVQVRPRMVIVAPYPRRVIVRGHRR
jgi:hypothetical protein